MTVAGRAGPNELGGSSGTTKPGSAWSYKPQNGPVADAGQLSDLGRVNWLCCFVIDAEHFQPRAN